MASASGRTTTHAPTSPLPRSIPSKKEGLGVSRTIMCLRAISDALRCAAVEIPAVRPSEAALVECAAAKDARAEVCRNSLRLVLVEARPFCIGHDIAFRGNQVPFIA